MGGDGSTLTWPQVQGPLAMGGTRCRESAVLRLADTSPCQIDQECCVIIPFTLQLPGQGPTGALHAVNCKMVADLLAFVCRVACKSWRVRGAGEGPHSSATGGF